jgi:hypothetical protein
LADALISVAFSERVDCAKLAGNTVTVSGGGLLLPGTVSCAQNTLSFNPTSDLPTNATLDVTVGAAVTDLAGNPHGTSFTWQFSIRAWTVHLGSLGADAFNAVQVDNAGNLFVAGSTSGSYDAASPNGGALLATYDAYGAQRWVRQIGARSDLATAVAVDSKGNVFVGGRADKYPVDFPRQAYSIFIAKYDKSGAQLWLRGFGSQSTEYVRALSVDADGNVVAVGYTAGNLFRPVAGGGSDFFVMKLDPAGNLLWGRQDGGPGNDNAAGIAISPIGELFVSGYVSSPLYDMTPKGSSDAFLIKYTAGGVRQWMTLFGTTDADFGQQVKQDVAGNLYLVGRTAGSFAGQTSAGGLDAFVAKLDPNGAVQWVRQFGTAGDDYPNALSIDSSGYLRVAGFTNGTFPGNSLAGGFDGFLVRLDSNASLQWARQWGAAGDDYVFGLAMDGAGNAFVASTGGVSGIAGAGDTDGFLLKFAADGTPR